MEHIKTRVMAIPHLPAEVLDALVMDVFETKACEINNQGQEDQIDFLIETHGTDVESIISEAMDEYTKAQIENRFALDLELGNNVIYK